MELWYTEKCFRHVSFYFIGCGNSRLAEHMYNDGFKHIINTDFSPTVIERMNEKYRTLHEMTWELMDITNMLYDAASFDVILEKGTLDALLVHEKDPWNISTDSRDQIDKILQQVIEKSREYHNHKPQPIPDTKWKRKRTKY